MDCEAQLVVSTQGPTICPLGTPGATHLASARPVLSAMSRLHGRLVQRFVRLCEATVLAKNLCTDESSHNGAMLLHGS